MRKRTIGFSLGPRYLKSLGEGYYTFVISAAPPENTGIAGGYSEFAISGTTITGKKLDGSTTAMTWTIDDSTSPTSRTRAS